MSGSQSNKPFVNVDQDHLFNESKVFCTMPWTHLHVTPFGAATPCCIAESCSTREGLGDATKLNLLELVNTDGMKQLRLDMLNGVKNHECKKCYEHEEQNVQSWRQVALQRYPSTIEDVKNTNSDGSVDEFHMRYYDMRFSNICNFKCRTCGQEFSSQWEQENLRSKVPWAYVNKKYNNTELVNDVVNQIDTLEHAYFAGGEPLIMEEHYILLEEMIRKGKTDIHLNYSTNLSNLKFKNKDLINLWSYFEHPISVAASIDHYGERAEYIRHGTDWGVVEANYKLLQTLPNIGLTINSVLSVFNYLTFYDFYSYIFDQGMYYPDFCVYSMSTPEHLACHILPDDLREIGIRSMKYTIQLLKIKEIDTPVLNTVKAAANWAKSKTTTYDYLPGTNQETIDAGLAQTNLDLFKEEIIRLDKLRNEDFTKVFPELKPLMDL